MSSRVRERTPVLLVAFAVVFAVLALLLPAAGVAATASWSLQPERWDFGTRLPAEGPSESKTFSLVNTGEVAISPQFVSVSNSAGSGFELGEDTCHSALAPDAGCTIKVTFHPRSGGRKEGTLAVETSTPGVAPAVAQLLGSGGEPLLKIDPGALVFETIAAGRLAHTSRSLTLTNEGSTELLIQETAYREIPTSNPPDFFSTGDGCYRYALPPGGSCSIALGFAPRNPGAYQAEFQFFDNAPGSPQTVKISGTAGPEEVIHPPVSLPPSPAVLTRRPARRTKARTATFAFSGDAGTAGFVCHLRGGPLAQSCRSPVHYRSLKPGRHQFSVRPIGADGIAGPLLTYSWRILR